jgi:hypothetical protein
MSPVSRARVLIVLRTEFPGKILESGIEFGS